MVCPRAGNTLGAANNFSSQGQMSRSNVTKI